MAALLLLPDEGEVRSIAFLLLVKVSSVSHLSQKLFLKSISKALKIQTFHSSIPYIKFLLPKLIYYSTSKNLPHRTRNKV